MPLQSEPSGVTGRLLARVLAALKRLGWFTAKLVLFVAGAVAVAAFSAWHVIDREFKESDVAVPNVVGQTVEEATATLSRAELDLRVDAHRYHEAPAGTIFYQEPPAGSRTRKFRGVKVVVSRGGDLIAVPDLRGQTLRGAALQLTNARLALGEVARVHADAGANHVIAQEPAAGAAAAEGQRVDVLLSLGPRRRSFVMPDLRGADLRRAEGTLGLAGLDLVDVRRDAASGAPADVVVSQLPPPGERIERDTSVTLVVGDGPERGGRRRRRD